MSKNNGESWNEITDPEPFVNTTPNHEQSIHRTVVMHTTDEHYIWATDDPIGNIDNYDPGKEELVWSPIEEAEEYRVIVRDYTLNEIVLKEIIPGTMCKFSFVWKEFELEHEYRYRIQYRISEEDVWEDTGEVWTSNGNRLGFQEK